MTEELWNNSWVKNLPVRPLAPRRKTPGQLNPSIQDLPGLGQKEEKKKANVEPSITRCWKKQGKKNTSGNGEQEKNCNLSQPKKSYTLKENLDSSPDRYYDDFTLAFHTFNVFTCFSPS